MPSRVTAAALGAAILLGASAPAYAAADPDGAPPVVQFSTARGDAPVLRPGMHRTAPPTGRTERYAAITRPQGGAVTVAIFGSVDAAITTTDGKNTCSSSGASLSNDVTGYTFLYVDPAHSERQTYQPDECASATDLILRIRSDDSSSSSSSSAAASGPLQVAVTVEPKLAAAGSPSPKDQQNKIAAPSTSTPAAERAVSDRLAAPTSLEPGSYRVSLTPGRLAVARVRVGWGQRLAASVDAPRNGSNFAPSESLDVALAAFSPQWAPVGGGDGSALLFKEESTERTASVYTAPVNRGNSKVDYDTAGDVGTARAQWTTVAGWYYVVVRVSATQQDQQPTTRSLPARLNLAVVGTPTAGPTYVGADGTAAAAPAATQLSQGGTSDSASGAATALRIGGSVFVVAAAAAVVAFLRRRA